MIWFISYELHSYYKCADNNIRFCWIAVKNLTSPNELFYLYKFPGIFQCILGNGIFCPFGNFSSKKRVILGKLLYVLIALILMLLSVFFIHNYLKDIYSMSHFYFCLPWLGVLHTNDFFICTPLFFLLK